LRCASAKRMKSLPCAARRSPKPPASASISNFAQAFIQRFESERLGAVGQDNGRVLWQRRAPPYQKAGPRRRACFIFAGLTRPVSESEAPMLLTPEIIFRRVEDITPAYLQSQGITALVLDVDNTLTGDGSQQLDPDVSAWLEAMRAAGVSLTIVSNNTGRRVRPFARRIGLAWVPLACKPLPVGLMVARRRLGVPRRQMAMVGDQLFTDRLAAGLYGIRCLSVLPRTP